MEYKIKKKKSIEEKPQKANNTTKQHPVFEKRK